MKNYRQIKILRILPVVFFVLGTTGYGFSQTCMNIELDAETIIISEDTTIHCDNFFQHFLICEGVTVNFFDNSCFNTFYLEPGSNLIYDPNSYGYSQVYASAGSTVHANSTHIQNITYEIGAHLIDTLSPYSPYHLYECQHMSFDYSLSGNCSQNYCEDVLIDAETIIITEDTTIHCSGSHQHFLICEGVTVIYFDWENSCFDTFYLESGSTLVYDPNSYGATVYASSGSTVYANSTHIQNITYEIGAHLIDTLSPYSPYHLYECQHMSFDYSLSGNCSQNYCEDVLIDAETIIITEDTTIHCSSFHQHFLICEGVTVNFFDNSCFNTFYLEPGSNLNIGPASHGYSNVYVTNGANFNANLTTFMNVYYEPGANIQDTAIYEWWHYNAVECESINYDYSLSGSCVTTGLENKKSSSLLVFPNPAKDFLQIESVQIIDKITIYNIVGEKVYDRSFSSNIIDISDIRTGNYFLFIRFSNGKSAIERFAIY